MSYLFTSESVSEGHPDKVSDQISDALLDGFLSHDPESKVACETLVTTGLVVCAGEVKSNAYIDIQDIARATIKNIGYTKAEYKFDADSCGVITTIHEQSSDINQGVVLEEKEKQGAGDQGMMFGYATKESESLMPLPIELSHILLEELARIRKEGKIMKYLRPDSKSQVTIEYNDRNKPIKIDAIVLSTQHDEFGSQEEMRETITTDIRRYLIPRVKKMVPAKYRRLFKGEFKLHVNPTGNFVIGGPHGDTGLTGRKIIVDTYGGKGAHGGGAFSGKDSSKVDRSAAYAARHIAKNMVAAGIANEVLVQVAYAIGVAEPVGFYVNTNGTSKVKDANGKKIPDGKIAEMMSNIFVMTPFEIVKRYGLKDPIFLPTAAYGHFGRDSYTKEVEVFYDGVDVTKRIVEGEEKRFKQVTFFGWEKLDYVDKIKEAFGIN